MDNEKTIIALQSFSTDTISMYKGQIVTYSSTDPNAAVYDALLAEGIYVELYEEGGGGGGDNGVMVVWLEFQADPETGANVLRNKNHTVAEAYAALGAGKGLMLYASVEGQIIFFSNFSGIYEDAIEAFTTLVRAGTSYAELIWNPDDANTELTIVTA